MEGYIYAVAFSDETIKVGRSGDAERRITQHTQTARAHGQTIVHSWFSIPHREYEENEKALIAWCSERASESRSRERFGGLVFPRVVRYALGLTMTGVTLEDAEREATQGQKIIELIQETARSIELPDADKPINFEGAMYSTVIDAYEKQLSGVLAPEQAAEVITAAYVTIEVLKKLYPMGVCPKGHLLQMIDAATGHRTAI